MPTESTQSIPDHGHYVHYSREKMAQLLRYLEIWEVDASAFNIDQRAKHISRETCRQVAHAIRSHFRKAPLKDQDWLLTQAQVWDQLADCGGTWGMRAAI